MFCPKCGKENLNSNKFCKACGKRFAAAPVNAAKVEPVAVQAIPEAAPMASPVPMPASPAPPPLATAAAAALPSEPIAPIFDGKYEIERKIASGGMGDLYLAKRLLVGDHVVLKLLRSHLRNDPAYGERFRLEALAATKIRHRNVIAIYDVGVSKDERIPYILMEYADGPTLRQFLYAEKSLRSDVFFSIAFQICSGLHEAHQLGIIHRDIKPENIMAKRMNMEVVVKILDFGIARMSENSESTAMSQGTITGTPNYMSPEQCTGMPATVASDIYSLGILLYELLSGRVPFKGKSFEEIAKQHREMPATPPRSFNPEVPEALEGVVMRAIAKDPSYRYQSVQEFSSALQFAQSVNRM